MINKLRRKFIIYSSLSVFILLFIVFLTVNITNFTMVANDADKVTEMIASSQGSFDEQQPNGGPAPGGRIGGPQSPEMRASTRYFTVSIDKKGDASIVAYHLTEMSMTQDEALKLAKELKNKSTGWVYTIYRYRVYKVGNITYVTVIDQNRELTPTYNVLWISLISLFVGSAISLLILMRVSKYLVKPIVDSDTKQIRFIKDATYALKTPTKIIEESNELLKKAPDPGLNIVIDEQIKKMNALINNMNILTILNNQDKIEKEEYLVSDDINQVVAKYDDLFKQNNLSFKVNLQDNLVISFDKQLFRQMINELLDNGLKYCAKYFNVKIEKEDERLIIETRNDCLGIEDGDQSRVFERFYRLDNEKTKNVDGNGLGLALVYEIVHKYNGRTSAKVNGQEFILKIEI